MTAPINEPEYNPDIPKIQTTIADGQELFLNNFSTLFDAFSENHIALDNDTSPGNHAFIELMEQKQSLSTKSQEVSFYTKKVEDQTTQIFMRYPGNGKEFQITQYQIYPLPFVVSQGITIQQPYFSTLPGGIIIYFGKIIPQRNNFAITLDPAICTNITGINLCPIGAANSQNFQSNVNPVKSEGKYKFIFLNSAATPLTQYYTIFGNI
jgi:hypothetical protein